MDPINNENRNGNKNGGAEKNKKVL